MLKRDPNGRFEYNTDLGWGNYMFSSDKTDMRYPLGDRAYHSLLMRQHHEPVVVMQDNSSPKRWWMFRDEFYVEDEGFSETETKALILDKIEQKKKRVQRAMARISQNKSGTSSGRQPIPDDVMVFVWNRDGGRCVKCGSQQNLEFDHIIPVLRGGSNTARNLQLLCEKCNRSKGANIA